MKNLVKKINIVLVVSVCLLILFTTSILFLGSEEKHLKLVSSLPESFFQRAFVGGYIGIFGASLILLINLLLKATYPAITVNLKKLLWTLIIAFCLSSLLGATFFFFH
jgi:hypothetical protein